MRAERVNTPQTKAEAYSSTHKTQSSGQQLAASAQLHRTVNTKKARVDQDDARVLLRVLTRPSEGPVMPTPFRGSGICDARIHMIRFPRKSRCQATKQPQFPTYL